MAVNDDDDDVVKSAAHYCLVYFTHTNIVLKYIVSMDQYFSISIMVDAKKIPTYTHTYPHR